MNRSVQYLQIHPKDNVLVALQDLEAGQKISFDGMTFDLPNRVKAKHKFTLHDLPANCNIIMYGVLVGRSQTFLAQGEMLTTSNTKHATETFTLKQRKLEWQVPDLTDFSGRTFKGYIRNDGKVGTANHWLVIPLVFCENKNIQVLKDALEE